MPPTPHQCSPEHMGTKRGYDLGCRAAECRNAHRIDRNTRRRLIAYGQWNRFVPSVGTARRIQALQACGWSLHELGRRAGVSATAIMRHRDAHTDTTRIDAADKIRALYDALWDVLPPDDTREQRQSVTRTLNIARDRGYALPLAWDDASIDDPDALPYADSDDTAALDEIAVERAMHGDPVPLTSAERAEAVARLTARGYSAHEIAERLHVTERTITRRRAA